jgi:hypothetical protein
MKYWKYSLWLSIFSSAILIAGLLTPASCKVFVWKKMGVDPGILFPVLLICWTTSLLAVAFNNIFVDAIYMEDAVNIKGIKKYIPSILSLPGLISFIWFCCRWYIGKP